MLAASSAFHWDNVITAVLVAIPATLLAAATLIGTVKTYRQSKRNHAQVEDQVKPNGGSSIKDQNNRIEQWQKSFSGEWLQFRIEDAAWKARADQRLDEREEKV